MIYKGDSIRCYSAIIVSLVLQELENVWIIALKSFPAKLLSPVHESSPHYTLGPRKKGPTENNTCVKAEQLRRQTRDTLDNVSARVSQFKTIYPTYRTLVLGLLYRFFHSNIKRNKRTLN